MLPTPNSQAAINTLLQRGNGLSPGTFATVANVSSIKGFNLSAMVVDVTSHSTGVPWRQKRATLLDAGELSMDIFFVTDSAGHRQLLADFALRTALPWRLVEPDTLQTVFECECFISKMAFDNPVDGVTKCAMVLTATGDPVLPTAGGTYD